MKTRKDDTKEQIAGFSINQRMFANLLNEVMKQETPRTFFVTDAHITFPRFIFVVGV